MLSKTKSMSQPKPSGEPTKAKWAANTKLLLEDGIEIDEDNETPASLREKIDKLINERVANTESEG